jgi:peptidylprolyl isomerase
MYSLVDGIRISVAGDQANGDITLRLFDVIAPLHVSRISKLTVEGAYDGVAFHRVIDGFMAQTGDVQFGNIAGPITYAGMGGSQYPDLPAELSSIGFYRGVVGMARSSELDSANSQFFMMFNYSPWLNGQYTVVGQVTNGIEVLDAIKRGDETNNGVVTSDPDYMAEVSLVTSDQTTLLAIDQTSGALEFSSVPNLATIREADLVVVNEVNGATSYGTVSYDDGINITDAVLLLKQIVGLASLAGNNAIAADANQDGQINISDAVAVLKHIVGLEPIDQGVKLDGAGVVTAAIHGESLDSYTFIQSGDVDLSGGLEII